MTDMIGYARVSTNEQDLKMQIANRCTTKYWVPQKKYIHR